MAKKITVIQNLIQPTIADTHHGLQYVAYFNNHKIGIDGLGHLFFQGKVLCHRQ